MKYSFYFVEPKNFPFFKWQYRAGAGAGAKIMKKGEPELEPKLNNFASATLQNTVYSTMPQGSQNKVFNAAALTKC